MGPRRTLFLVTGLSSFLVYFVTLAPTITWRNGGVDSGDLAAAVAVKGIPHPPGYPTYLILGEVFKRLPIGDVAYRLNLLSALCAALTVALMSLTIYQTLTTKAISHNDKPELTKRKRLILICSASAALTLAFSNTYWSQAVITEVYALNLLFFAAIFYSALQVSPNNQHWLVPSIMGLLGLGLGNHFSIFFIIPILICILRVRWRWQLILGATTTFCAGLFVYLLIPIRAATFPAINWGMAVNWSNFLWFVSAAPYRQFLFALPPQFLPIRIVAEFQLLVKEFMWWGVPVALWGLRPLFKNSRALVFGSIATFILTSVYAIGYNTTDSFVYLLPAFLMVSFWVAWGLYNLGSYLSEIGLTNFNGSGIITGLVVFLLPILSLLSNFSGQNISWDHQAYSYGKQSLRSVAPNAVIITDDDPQTFALWYTRYGLELRSDVAIVNSNLLLYDWYRNNLSQVHSDLVLIDRNERPITTSLAFIEYNIARYPLYLATTQSLLLEDYQIEPVSSLQRIIPNSN